MPNGIPKPDNKLMREWSLKVKQQDDFKCAICGSKQMPNAHHIIPKERKEFRFLFLNGITLCPSHHKFNNILSAHKNPMAFYLWMAEHRAEQLEWVLSKCRL